MEPPYRGDDEPLAPWETLDDGSALPALGLSDLDASLGDDDSDPLQSRYLELSRLREERLANETERLQREISLVSERLRSERQIELRHLREDSEKTQTQLANELAQERGEKAKLVSELVAARDALLSDNKRLKAVNQFLENEMRQAQGRLAAATSAGSSERDNLFELNRNLESKLRSVQERLEGLDQRYRAQITFLESGAQKLRDELALREEAAAQSREAAQNATRRAEEAERAIRNWEDVWRRQEEVIAAKVEPRLRAEFQEALEGAERELRAAVQLEFEQRLAKDIEELRLAQAAAQAEERERMTAEKDAALAQNQSAFEEGQRRGRADGLRAGAADSAEKLRLAQVETSERLKRLAAFYERRFLDHEEQAAKTVAASEARANAAQAEAEQKLTAWRREADERFAAEQAQWSGKLRAAQTESIEKLRAAQTEAEERLSRLAADHERRVQGLEEEARLAREAALSAQKAELLEAKERDSSSAVQRARTEVEEALSKSAEARLADERAASQRAREEEIAKLREQFEADKHREIDALRRAQGEAEVQRLEEYLGRLTASREQWQRARDAEAIELRAQISAEREKEMSQLRSALAAENAASRKALEEERRGLEAEITRRVRKEAELEATQRTEKLTADWHALRGRFEEQLSTARDEFKKREREWTDRLDERDREILRLRDQAKGEIGKMENEGVQLASEKGRLQERVLDLESGLRKSQEEAASAARAAATQAEEAARRESALRADLEGKLAAASKESMAKLKALQADLRAAVQRSAELLDKNDILEKRSVWSLMGGGKQ